MRFFVLGLFYLGSLFGTVNQNGDFQVWNSLILHKKIDREKWLRFEGETRLGDNASKLFVYFLQGQFVYRPYEFFMVAPGYRQAFTKRLVPGKWKQIYHPMIDFTFIYIKNRFGLSNRNRIQYLIRESKTNQAVLRMRLRLSYKTRYVRPYIEDEVFFRETRGFSQNRLAIGTFIKPSKHFYARLFYLFRYNKSTSWKAQNVLGAYLYLLF